jgi:type III secretion protein S
MDEYSIVEQFQTAMHLVAIVAAPPLLVAMLVGLITAVLQSATQIQDQTLPLTVKIFAVGLVLTFFGQTLTRPLTQYADRIFDDFPSIAR